MRSIHKFNLTAVLLSATVISTPSPASTLPQTLSEHRDLSAQIYLPLTDARGGSSLPQFPNGARLLHEHYGASEVKIVLEKNIKCDKLRSDLKTTGAGFPHITLTIMEG